MTDVDLAYTLWISQHLLQPEPSVNEMEEWIYARLSLLTPEVCVTPSVMIPSTELIRRIRMLDNGW